MRIVVVSAHFPPNFVSGGTLQPQRLARGLRARGHDVDVYAGWLGDRPPLDSWAERDETGLPVQWVATGSWIGWSDTRNFDNPQVAAHFRSFLADRRPDVVHLHSLQSLGAGLLPVAAEAGARVVVTMHDFWWCCARQFLVDKEMRPCPLVVAAGACACEVDHDWLQSRNRRLAAMLARADLVLAPSAVAARVLAANGVDEARLEVDENGLEDGGDEAGHDEGWGGGEPDDGATTEARAHRAPGKPLRFVYTGGGNALKGVDVLFRAARRLSGTSGWALAAYGADVRNSAGGTTADGTSPAPEGVPVTVLPAFDPSEAERVYASADVVVVPSLMRESHSLVTREALTRGIPVICTDTLGPEEVVDHGRNGLVVAAGDHVELASAMRRLVEEPDVLAELRRGAAGGVAVRSLGDQVAGLERRYQSLLGASRSPASDGIGRVLFMCGIEGAPLRYRARLPAEGLEALGVRADVRHYRHPEVRGLAERADALVVYRVPATTQVLAVIARARQRGTPVFFDVDDLIFDPELAAEIPALSILPEAEAALWMEGVRRYRTTMEACDAFVGSTDPLCRHASAVTGMATHRFANGVGMELGRISALASARSRRAGPPRIGYLSGTTTHDRDWAFVEPAVVELMGRHPGLQLWLGGHVAASAALEPFAARVLRLPMLPWTKLPAVLADLDVNLAPLEPGSRFNEAKSAIKWLEAALTATPTVASPTEPFREAVTPGETGLLAGSVEEWAAAVESLLVDEGLRDSMGRKARREALLRWSPLCQGRRYLGILEDGAPEPGPRTGQDWEPVVLDEPFERIDLEPYREGRKEPAAGSQRPAVTSWPGGDRRERAVGTVRDGIEKARRLARRARSAIR